MKIHTGILVIAAAIGLAGLNAHAEFREVHALQATIDTTQSVETIYAELRSSAKTACSKMTQPGRDHARNVRICSKEVLIDWIDNSGLDLLVSYHEEQIGLSPSEFQIASGK